MQVDRRKGKLQIPTPGSTGREEVVPRASCQVGGSERDGTREVTLWSSVPRPLAGSRVAVALADAQASGPRQCGRERRADRGAWEAALGL